MKGIAAIGRQSDRREGHVKCAILGHGDEIAGHRQGGGNPGARAVDLRDIDHIALVDLFEQGQELPDDQVGNRIIAKVGDVTARREPLARPLEDAHPNALGGFDQIEHRRKLGTQGFVEGIVNLRPVERDTRHRPLVS